MEHNYSNPSLEDSLNTNINTRPLTERKKKIALKNYFDNKYLLENQSLRNGFGKMVLSRNQTNPKFTFGKEKRFFSLDKRDDLPFNHEYLLKQKNGNIITGYHYTKKLQNKKKDNFNYDEAEKDYFLTSGNLATDFYYKPTSTYKYKHPKCATWTFTKADRFGNKNSPKYQFYNLKYDKKTDNENAKKKWRNRIIGGHIDITERFENNKMFEDMMTPGPGRYNPKINYFKYDQSTYGYMGVKTDYAKYDKNNKKKMYKLNYTNSPKNVVEHISHDKNNKKIAKMTEIFGYKYKNEFKANKYIDIKHI